MAKLETHNITQNLPSDDNNQKNQLIQGTILEGRYLIEGILGVGGMGAVYKARDLRFNVVKNVAIKEMINLARDELVRETIVKNFEREANILATLSHQAIPTIYDYFTRNDRSYLVMELISGKNLEVLLTENPSFFPESQVITWAIELCDVLNYLHNHKPTPIIFRDMKPANIIINPENHVVLVDFGIAKTFQSGQKGTMIGTEGYSPPEQYRGEATPLVDIYALGATLHHILTKKDPRIEAPFTFSDRPIRKINPNVSVELEAVINTALQYNPADRFQSAAEMKDALIAAAKKTGLLADIAVPTTHFIDHQNIKPFWEFECEDEIRGSATYHDGILFVGSYDTNLYALNAETGDFIWKYPTDGGVVTKPVVFDNNVYFGSEDGLLHVVSLHSGRITWTYYTDMPIRSSPVITEMHVFFGSDDGNLHVVNAANGRRVLLIDAGSPIRSSPVIHNEFVYFGAESGDFWCTDFRGNVKWRTKAKRAITGSAYIDEDIVYYNSMDATLYSLDAKSGWVIWRYRLGKGSISTPTGVDHYIFTGSIDHNIYAIDKRTGKEVWRYTTEHQVTGSPVIYKDSLYCGSVDGNLYCLEYKTGRLRWQFATEGPITSTPIIHNDVIYITSFDHKVYALPA